MLDFAEKEFLVDLFLGLAQSGSSYCVMRNHKTLPYSHGGSDLDILVAPQSRQAVLNAIDSAMACNNAVRLGISFAPDFFKVYVFGYNSAFDNGWWGLCIDINLGLYFKGLPLWDEYTSLPIEQYNAINVLTPGFAGVLGVLKEVLNNSELPQRYLSDARVAAANDWHKIQKLLAPMGPDALEKIHQLILGNPKKPHLSCTAIQRSFLHYRLKKAPASFFAGRLGGLFSKIARYFKPSGIVIAILGTDGAGKSTIIDAIKPALDEATHNATVLRHLRPNLLPPLGRLKGKSNIPAGPVTNPHGSSASGFLGSLVRLVYATANYVLGYWLETRLQIAKQPTVVIFDRYAYDMVLDQKRFRINLSPALVRFFTRVAPKPDLILCLYGSPEVLASRKQELPLEEVTRQVDALKAFAYREPRAILVNTEQSIEACRDQILQAIVTYCDNRARQ